MDLEGRRRDGAEIKQREIIKEISEFVSSLISVISLTVYNRAKSEATSLMESNFGTITLKSKILISIYLFLHFKFFLGTPFCGPQTF